MAVQTPAVQLTPLAPAPFVAPELVVTPAVFKGTAAASSIAKGSVWKDGSYYITITDFDNDIVEYGYPHRRDVYYLTRSNFERQFTKLPAGHIFSKKEKDFMMAELRKCLEEIKEKNLGDHVYFMMDELGL